MEAVLGGQNVLAELSAERRQPLADLGEPRLAGLVERRAGAHEDRVIAVEHLALLVVEAERVARLPERIDAREQRCVEIDRIAVAGEQRRDLALHRLQRLVGVGRGEMEEDRGHPVEAEAARLQRDDRIGESRRLRRLRDRARPPPAAPPWWRRRPGGNARAGSRRRAAGRCPSHG